MEFEDLIDRITEYVAARDARKTAVASCHEDAGYFCHREYEAEKKALALAKEAFASAVNAVVVEELS